MEAADTDVHTILVAEDDVLIRLNIADFLRSCGYRVLEAGTAAEAISIIEGGQVVDLVFSDIQMPGEMDGFGLAQWVRRMHPDIRIILTSGYEKAAERAGELCDDGPLIDKPYEVQAVVRRIKQMLSAAANRATIEKTRTERFA